MPFLEISEEFLTLMQKGDPRCKHKFGERIVKIAYPDSDLHAPGHQGRVTGSVYHPMTGEAYLVVFDGENHATFIAGVKIEKAPEK